MSIVKQPGNGHGSLKDIQELVNKNQDLINNLIKKEFPEMINENIYWKSPLEEDDFAEYRDNDFIDVIGLDRNEIKIQEFWPERGPQWDALATTSESRIILVEAKANIREIVSPPSSAGSKSKTHIDQSLNETKIALGVKNYVDWSGKFYQFTNRLAHLYFLRDLHKKPVYLINIYFIGDKSVYGPDTIGEWKAALQVLYSYLGLTNHKLSKFMADIFIDVNVLNH